MTAPADNSRRAPVALVTGASSGIGRALAALLSRRGYAVALNARREAELERLAVEIRERGGEAIVLPGDASDPAAVQRLVADCRERLRGLDLVVANAGAYLRKPAVDTDRDDVESMLRSNFWSGFELSRAALPHLTAQGSGQLVFVSSFDAVKGMPHDAAYVAAKSALVGYAGCLRQGLRGTGVHVCAVLPGRVDTPMVEDLEVPAISAKVRPERVARAVVRALRRRASVVVVPWHCRLLHWADVLSPRLADWLVRRLGLDGARKS